ncbi:MAG: transposase [Sphingobacteriaceae bacterium]|nr:transposase [Cytophagaceae bacterium]
MGFAYRIGNQQALHFVTATVEQWVDVFTRPAYVEILLDSLRHCQREKGLDIYAWVIMSNHFHAILACREGFHLSNALRDMKKFTSTAITEAIAHNPQESRKNWLLWLLRPRDTEGQPTVRFWQAGNHPEEIRTEKFFQQKMNYIHLNPVRAGLVERAEDYRWSSAGDFYGRPGLLELSYWRG